MCGARGHVPSRQQENPPVGFILLWVGSGSPGSGLHWSATAVFPVHLSTGPQLELASPREILSRLSVIFLNVNNFKCVTSNSRVNRRTADYC